MKTEGLIKPSPSSARTPPTHMHEKDGMCTPRSHWVREGDKGNDGYAKGTKGTDAEYLITSRARERARARGGSAPGDGVWQQRPRFSSRTNLQVTVDVSDAVGTAPAAAPHRAGAEVTHEPDGEPGVARSQ